VDVELVLSHLGRSGVVAPVAFVTPAAQDLGGGMENERLTDDAAPLLLREPQARHHTLNGVFVVTK
jgi:hypothetical protein